MFTFSGGKLLARLAQSLESLAAHEGLWTGRRDGGPCRRLVRPDDGGQAPTAQAGAQASLRNRLRCLSFCMCSERFAQYSPTVQAGGRQKKVAKPSEKRQFASCQIPPIDASAASQRHFRPARPPPKLRYDGPRLTIPHPFAFPVLYCRASLRLQPTG